MTSARRAPYSPVLVLVAGAFLFSCGKGPAPAQCDDSCLTPPAPSCVEDTLVTYSFLGECVDGECSYSVAAEQTCANGCADGACVVIVEPCDEVVCETPPEAACEDDVRVSYGEAGVCDDESGECSYAPVRTDCGARGQVCRSGACVPPGLCDGVDCSVAPEPRCNGRRLTTSTDDGVCDEATGECRFTETVVDCGASDQVCRDGACIDLPACDGLDCSAAPAVRCDGSVAVVSSNPRCDVELDACAWDEVRDDCFERDLACAAGACVASDVCDDVTCGDAPAASCDGEVVVESGAGGRCDATSGRCRWPEIRRDCGELDLQCVEGACTDALCDGVVCSVAPVARCDANVAVTSVIPGICSRGRCSYDPVRTNCEDSDQICVSGACVERPVCDTLVCDAPPAATCDDDVAVTYAALGTCSDGACSYAATRNDCDARGQGCRDGACFDRCEGVECLDTPEPYCIEQVLHAPTGSGLCDSGLCSFAEVTIDCGATGQRCIDGGCRTPCYDIVCDAPPAPVCDGDSVLEFVGTGVCNDSTASCNYPPTVRNCALSDEVCIGGACVPDPCLTAVCDAPPAPFCDADVLRTPQGPGACFDRACQYFERTTNCSVDGGSCAGGACRDRCFGVACELPPASVCEGDTAVSYAAVGVCNPTNASCSYARTVANCSLSEEVCRSGRCVPPPCAGITCDEAPAPSCSGETLVTYIAPGACDEGLCEYPNVTRNCGVDGGTCRDGACRDRCDGVVCATPPAQRCTGDVLLSYAPAGTCDPTDGLCDYSSAARNCRADGLECRDGACLEPLCTGVTCGPAPAPVCEGDVLLSAFGAGTCDSADGLCDYATLREDCSLDGGRCGDGRCISACEDLNCAAEPAPAPICSGDIAVTYQTPGLCDSATVTCDFTTQTRNCVLEGLICDDGVCIPPRCTGVTCDAPPAPVCDGATLRSAFGAGICDPADGLCDYAESLTNCSVDNGRCEGGRCVSVCEGVVCDDQPEAFCGGTIAFQFPGAGTCLSPSGTCRYTAVPLNCFLAGDVCRDGLCVEPPCTGVTCDTPPTAYCDGSTSIAAYGVGSCEPESGDCAYATITQDCSLNGGRCEGGVCRELCDGVVCNEFPADTCAGDVALAYINLGVCSTTVGGCFYTPTTTNCASAGLFCQSGRCVDPPCTGVTCDSPAAPVCDGNVLVSEFGAGFCDLETGICGYAATQDNCADDGGECRDGACLEICDLLVCDEVPEDACSGDTALVYDTVRCNGTIGACEYPPTAVNCAALSLVCRDGACIEPPCSGVTCNAPAAPSCDGNTLVTEYGAGTCEPDTGVCNYLSNTENCADDGGACVDGRCVEFCDLLRCDDVPADTCDGDVASDYTAGRCNPITQVCDYTPVVTNCALTGEICRDGACVVSPCLGVSCEVPAAPFCDGEVRVAQFGAGTCNSATGGCEHSALTEDCSLDFGACRDGACLEFCDLERCDQVPDDACVGDVAFAYSIGVCNQGALLCEYPALPTNCATVGLVCRAGACAPSLCEGVSCEAPRAPFCTGNTAVAEFGTGTCSETDGICQYTAITEDCTLDGGICESGICLDPCDFLVCDNPPANRCEGDVVFDFTLAGECNPLLGGCEYLPTFENCADTDQICEDAQCVDSPCLGVTCDDAPPPFCDANVLVSVPAGGICDELDGSCDYASSRFDCSSIDATCRNGRCEDRCVGVACNNPPADFCEGDTARQFAASGACTLPDGTCTYTPISTNCALEGDICRSGACVANPCDGVDCSTPPAPICQGNTAITSLLGASCNRVTGACAWDTVATDCAAAGNICLNGVCQSRCATTTCDAPPAPICLSSIAVGFADPGTCDPATIECVYEPLFENCSLFGEQCIAGQCVPIDFCEGVICDEAPLPQCDDRVVLTYADTGVCVGGGCEYEVTELDCEATGLWCEDAECVDVDPCIGVTCLPPSDPVCVGNFSVRDSAGVCTAGECNYAPVATNCTLLAQECRGGVCTPPEPCGGGCNNPPAPTCQSGRAIQYAPTGVCSGDVCVYTPVVEDCQAAAQVCAQGVCYDEDPCGTVTCTTPPPDTCAGDTIVEYRALGGCIEGACRYGSDLGTNCAERQETCLNGACQPGPCTGVNCFAPASICLDEIVRRVYVSGTCLDGDCNYTSLLEDCTTFSATARCFSGVCADSDPCEGIVCNTPRPPFCDGDTAILFGASGTCGGLDGRCTYPSTREDCTALDGFCTDGACSSIDPCVGVVCNDAPADSCNFNFVTDYPNVGVCGGGECVYEPASVDCGAEDQFCFEGACQDTDPCASLGCSELIAPICEGNTAVAFSRGFCNGGVCIRTEFETNCSATGATCVSGVCVGGNPCLGVTCSTPPAPTCRGDRVVVSALPGTCTAGTCGYAETVTNCGAVGDTCFDAACVPPIYGVRSGEIAISEILPQPSAEAWFEVANTRASPLNMRGAIIRNPTNSTEFTVELDVVIPVGGFAVFGASGASAANPDYVWPAGFSLTAPNGSLRIRAGGSVLDDQIWTSTWPFSNGRAMQLSADETDASANNSIANWCVATATYTAGRFGTPGAANAVCP